MRIVSVQAHFWDVSHHSRVFQRKWGQDSNLAIVKCWMSFVWSVLLLIYLLLCFGSSCCEWPNFFWVSDHKQTLWHSSPDITRNSLVPQWLQAVQTLRQQNSPISLHSPHNPSQPQWCFGNGMDSFVFFSFILGIYIYFLCLSGGGGTGVAGVNQFSDDSEHLTSDLPHN